MGKLVAATKSYKFLTHSFKIFISAIQCSVFIFGTYETVKHTDGSFTCCEFMSSDKGGFKLGVSAGARDSGSLEVTDEGSPVCDRN